MSFVPLGNGYYSDDAGDYGPYTKGPAGFVLVGTTGTTTEGSFRKGANGFWWRTSDNSGPYVKTPSGFQEANGLAAGASASGSGGGLLVGSSRLALASDNGATLELANGVTYTLTDAVLLPAGVALQGPETGTATIACTGTAKINGGTSSVSVAALAVYAAVPGVAVPSSFRVKGS